MEKYITEMYYPQTSKKFSEGHCWCWWRLLRDNNYCALAAKVSYQHWAIIVTWCRNPVSQIVNEENTTHREKVKWFMDSLWFNILRVHNYNKYYVWFKYIILPLLVCLNFCWHIWEEIHFKKLFTYYFVPQRRLSFQIHVNTHKLPGIVK